MRGLSPTRMWCVLAMLIGLGVCAISCVLKSAPLTWPVWAWWGPWNPDGPWLWGGGHFLWMDFRYTVALSILVCLVSACILVVDFARSGKTT
jgi:hypothetical protein